MSSSERSTRQVLTQRLVAELFVAAAILAFEDAQVVRLPEERASQWKQSGRIEALRGRQ